MEQQHVHNDGYIYLLSLASQYRLMNLVCNVHSHIPSFNHVNSDIFLVEQMEHIRKCERVGVLAKFECYAFRCFKFGLGSEILKYVFCFGHCDGTKKSRFL